MVLYSIQFEMEGEGQEEEEFTPRNYQVALLEACLQHNTIIFLPTGAGKTFIAVMALKRMGAALLGENHKVCIILVNTVALVDQHTKYIRRHTPFECDGFSGEMAVDFWQPEVWRKHFKKNQVLVMTCEILAGIVRGNIFNLNSVNLLIFDECHHAVSDHSMRQIMTNFQNLEKQERPRVIGLTATLLNGNCKPNRVMTEVRNLEVTFHAKVATVDGLENVVGFATNPMEILVSYPKHQPGLVEIKSLSRLDDLCLTLDNIKCLTPEINQRLKNSNLVHLNPDDGLRRVINFIKDLRVHIEMLGVYGGKLACLAYTIQVERLKKMCDNNKFRLILNYIQTVFCQVTQILENEMKSSANPKERFEKFSTAKLLALVKCLKNFQKVSDEPLCGLIFVERRFTAKLIFHILDSLSKNDPELSFLRTDFMVGNNNNPMLETREGLYLSKKNKQVLERFDNKELNLICTSQILEEGIDIAQCTMVCRFDLPKDYRSYIQSKGRARHKKSHYYMLVEENKKGGFEQKLTEYQEIEELLNNFLIGKNEERLIPSKREIAQMYNECTLPPYYVNGPGSAYFNEISAISLLCRYCQSLPADEYTVHSPEWYIEKIEHKSETHYVVTLLMPIVCPLIDAIEGLPMKSKKMAKRAVAYETCKRLHQCGELNDSLLPIERIVPDADVSYLFTHHPEQKETGAGMKKIRMHNLKIPNAASGKLSSENEMYLHIIHLNPQFHRPENVNNAAVYEMYTSDLCFGLITPKPLPSVFSFPTYISNGTVMVSILNNAGMVGLSNEELKKIRAFHFTIFNDVLEILPSFLVVDDSTSAESMFLVPVRRSCNEIDYNVLNEFNNIKSKESTLTHAEKLGIVVNDETYLNKIVIPTYRRDVSTYLVTRVCSELCPTSPFPNEVYKSFVNYYQEKHHENIINHNQSMLLVKGLSRKINLYKPEGIEKKRKKEKIYEELQEYLVPEMLVKQDFPAALWIQARFLPTVLSRLTFCLRVEGLWRNITEDCNFILKDENMRPLELNLNLIKYNAMIDEKDGQPGQNRINYEKVGGLPALPTSLKSSACNRDFKAKILEGKYPWKDLDEPKDIERTLEVSVMDIEAYENFINYSVSGNERVDIYKSPVKSKYPALTYDKEFVEKPIKILTEKSNGIVELADMYEALTTAKANDIVNLERLETLGDSFLKYVTSFYIFLKFPKYDEGRSTSLKSRIISNKNLFYIANKHNIGGIMKNKDLAPKTEWTPPGFSIPDQIRERIDNKKVSTNCLFKCKFSREERISADINENLLETLFEEHALDGEEDAVYQNMDQFFKKQSLKDKCMADVIEAILGTYLQNTGFDGCLKVMHWLGIIPLSERLDEFLKQSPLNPIIKENITIENILFHIPCLDQIEEIIGYEFQNKGYLLQAFTHSSYSPNRITRSYEKLEFLGDAIMDFLITCFIFESCGYLTPGELTDLRSALVNNNTFASYIVRLGLHKYLLIMNSKLQSHIDKFVEFSSLKNFVIDDEVLILLEEKEMNIAEYVDVPKVLGDMFEALAGAIFLDSGYCLDTVWKVFYKIMWREIDLFSRNVPKNMVRKLYECEGAYPEFSKAEFVQNGRVMVKLYFHADGRPKYVHGFGSNKVMAKKAAAKIALRYL